MNVIRCPLCRKAIEQIDIKYLAIHQDGTAKLAESLVYCCPKCERIIRMPMNTVEVDELARTIAYRLQLGQKRKP